MAVVGLTGGIASGKSTVARFFEARGAAVFDADQVARDVVAPGRPAYDKVVGRFGAEVLDGSGEIDRRKLGGLAFADEQSLKDLEAITHPEILRVLEEQIRRHKRRGQIAVIEAALIVETLPQWQGALRLDEIVVVVAGPEDQVRRLVQSGRMTEQEALVRIKAQGDPDSKIRAATYAIDNSGSIEELEEKAGVLWRRLRAGRAGL